MIDKVRDKVTREVGVSFALPARQDRETSNTDPSSVVRSGAGTKEGGPYFPGKPGLDVGRSVLDVESPRKSPFQPAKHTKLREIHILSRVFSGQ